MFVDGSFEAGDRASLSGGDARKLTLVLRRSAGDWIEVCDSTGRIFAAQLEFDGATLLAALRQVVIRPSEVGREIVLCQAIPKGAKMDFVVEKATELGVTRILPVRTERTVAEGEGRLDRWRRLARTAAAQCGRSRIPAIDPPAAWEQAIDGLAGAGATMLFPWELAERVPLREALPPLLEGSGPLAVLIGPEGGIAHEEASYAIQAGAHAVSLGPRIFRTETAGLVAVSILLYALGEL